MSRKLIVLLALIALTSVSFGDEVLGNWETSNDGWGMWSGGVVTNPDMTYGNSVGVTLGSGSGFVTCGSGWNDIVALDLNYDQRVALFNNDKLSIDFATGSAGVGGGSWIIEKVTFNTPGYGFSNPFVFGRDEEGTLRGISYEDGWDGAAIGRPMNLVVDYDPAQLDGGNIPGYCQIIFTLQALDTAADFYFDNAVLTPEPMTVALLGLGGLFLRRRK
ncbi:MAG: PEP-CTERM sorting domain-containing protein [Phycisphaerae bacterium]|jgi:hypothetical protein